MNKVILFTSIVNTLLYYWLAYDILSAYFRMARRQTAEEKSRLNMALVALIVFLCIMVALNLLSIVQLYRTVEG